jgi:hypothetical protein
MAAGVLALAYGGFTYTEGTHEANIGSMHMSIDDRRHVGPALACCWSAGWSLQAA